MLKIGMSEGIKQGLCHVLRLHIVLSTSELIEELEYEALENKRKAMKKANDSRLGSAEPEREKEEPKKDTRTNAENPKHNNGFGPNGPERITEPKVTNAELGKIAGVMKFTYIKVDIQTIKMVTQ